MLDVGFIAISGMVFWVLAARTITAEEVGLATAVISAATLIASLSRLGMDEGMVRYFPQTENKKDLYSMVVVITTLLSLILTAIFLINLNFFSPALIFLREKWFLLAFTAYVIIYSLSLSQNTALIAMRKSYLYFLKDLLLGLRIPVLFLIIMAGVLGVISSISLTFLISVVFGAYILHKCGISFKPRPDIGPVRNILGFSLGNYISGLPAIVYATVIPIMIINTLGAEQNAYFYIAYSISGLLFMIPNAISGTLFVEGSHDLPLKENTIKSIKFALLLLIPSVMFIVLFGDKLLMFFNKEYSVNSFEILRLLSISSIFGMVCSIYSSIKKIQKDIKMVNYINFALSALILGLGYIFMIKYGLIGLGYAWLFSNLIVCVFVMWMALRREKIFGSLWHIR
jgi:O-antigen/teichoic acid export membrane protein